MLALVDPILPLDDLNQIPQVLGGLDDVLTLVPDVPNREQNWHYVEQHHQDVPVLQTANGVDDKLVPDDEAHQHLTVKDPLQDAEEEACEYRKFF